MSDFEYEDEDDATVEVENAYYAGEDAIRGDPTEAKALFAQVIEIGPADWSIKAAMQLVLLSANDEQEEKRHFETLLSLTDQVTRNQAMEALQAVLSRKPPTSDLYDLAMDILKKTQQSNLWFLTGMKRARLLIDSEPESIGALLSSLLDSCYTEEGAHVDIEKTSYVMEISALQLQIFNSPKQLCKIHQRVTSLGAVVVTDPRSLAVIRELGGRIAFTEGRYDSAYNELFEAFKLHQEAGNSAKAREVLKSVIVSNILGRSDINPFDSLEARALSTDAEIAPYNFLRTNFYMYSLPQLFDLLANSAFSAISVENKKELLDFRRTALLLGLSFETINLDHLVTSLAYSSLLELLPLLSVLIQTEKIRAVLDLTTNTLVRKEETEPPAACEVLAEKLASLVSFA